MNSSYGSRPMTQAQARQMMGTRSGLTSSMGTTAAQGVAMNRTVQVSDRPVTMQGMRGMMQTSGGSRQVQDPSYYIGVLQNKINELQNEIKKLDGSVATYERDMSDFGGIVRKHETILNEVRELEGRLADYNLAMDKARVGTDISELEDYVNEYEKKNQRVAEEVDRIFMAKKRKDDEIKSIDAEIKRLHSEAMDKINQLEPRKLDLYNRLLGQIDELVNAQQAAQQEIDILDTNIQELDMSCQGTKHYNQEYDKYHKKLLNLEKEEDDLQQEIEIWENAVDSREAMNLLKKRVESQSKQLKDADLSIRSLKDGITSAKKQLKELDDELNEKGKNDTNSAEKYEKLRQRDEEMSEFIKNFDETKATTLQDQKQSQETIVALLEHISQNLDSQHTIPSQQEFENLKDQATFKQKQFESAQHTTQRLFKEKAQREAELAKIEHLDEKIQIELNSLHEKMALMKADMIQFDDLDTLRQNATTTMTNLERLLSDYAQRKDAVKSQVAQLSTKYETLKSNLASSDTHKSLSALEAKLRTYAQTIFHLQEFVESKQRQTDYIPIRNSCNSIVDSLNVHAKKAAIGA